MYILVHVICIFQGTCGYKCPLFLRWWWWRITMSGMIIC